ncbi:MAG: GNAT family N-acetyltransferase [Rhodomicrobium sp.]
MAGVTPPRPLRETDNRDEFDCGKESLNLWFRRHAWANQAASVSRTSVITAIPDGQIIGFVSLSTAQIERAFLPRPQHRNKPDPVPVALLGQLAVHKDHQRRGHARSLLLFALKTSMRLAQEVGCFGVVTHPVDQAARSFYARWGFQDLPFDPRGAMIVRMIDLEHVLGGVQI